MKHKRRNIVLIGFMGSGKTTLGLKLSYLLRMPVEDTDKLMERQEGRSITQIFADDGESYFRELETELLRKCGEQKYERILSVGGGTPVNPVNRPLLHQCGTVVYLRVSPEVVYERLKNDTTRPLLQCEDPLTRIRELLEILLTSEGYAVTLASSGEQALQLLSPELDLVILDIMMPGISGIRVCEAIRKQSNVPVLFLTAKGQDEDISLGLRVGADDYLPKPFSHAQLTARVKSLLRRFRVYQGKSEPEEDEWLVRGPLRINRTYNEVEKNGQPIDLPELEYQMLLLMASHAGRIFSAQNLYESVWNEPYLYSSNGTVMVHIRKLRVKLEDDPQNPKLIQTVWGKGYRFG